MCYLPDPRRAGHVEAVQFLSVWPCVCPFICSILLYEIHSSSKHGYKDLGIWGVEDWGSWGLGDQGIGELRHWGIWGFGDLE